MDEVGFSEEFEKFRLRHEALKEQVANEIETYSHLVDAEGPAIEAHYMMAVGQFECQAMCLVMEVKRWKRRFALRQKYLNRGEKPDMLAIEAQLDKEFLDWRQSLDEWVNDVKAAKLLWDTGRLSPAETNAIRCEYLKAVKKLHPDLNGNLSEAAVSLWNRIQKAYSSKEWRQLKFLVSLVDEVVGAAESFDGTADGLEALRAACARLEAKEREVSAQIAELKSKAPFTYEVLLNDPLLLKRKQDLLKKKIGDLKAAIGKYEKEWGNG